MATDRVITEVQGVVAGANERGFRLDGRDAWLNVSKYAAGVSTPPVGARVVAGLDKAGFVREVRIDGAAAAVEENAEPTATPANRAPLDKETRIVRMNALGHAVAIAAMRGQVELADVLDLAGRLEHWVNR